MKIYRLIVCGDREWTEAWPIRRELEKLCQEGEVELLIHGDARGADTIAGVVGAALGIPIKAMPARWKLHGHGAGPFRNGKMLEKLQEVPKGEERILLVLAYHKDLKRSKGTKHMVGIAQNAGILVKVFKS
jgi:hypothetical protein